MLIILCWLAHESFAAHGFVDRGSCPEQGNVFENPVQQEKAVQDAVAARSGSDLLSVGAGSKLVVGVTKADVDIVGLFHASMHSSGCGMQASMELQVKQCVCRLGFLAW